MYKNIINLLILLDSRDKRLLIKYSFIAFFITSAEVIALSSIIPILGLILNDNLITGFALKIINFFKLESLLNQSFQIFFFLT